MLYKTGKNGKFKPVAFFAKHFAFEYNYEIYNKELLAIVKVLKNGALNYKELSNYFKSSQTIKISRFL